MSTSKSIWAKYPAPTGGGGKGLTVGETVEGVFELVGMTTGWTEDEQVLEVKVGDRSLWAKTVFHRALADSGVQNGDRVRIERLPDTPIGGGKRMGTYQIEILAGDDMPAAPAW